MKVLLAAGLYPPDIGGPARYAQMIVEELPKHEIEVVVVPYSMVRSVPKLIRHTMYAYRLWQQRQGISLVYALDPISVGLPALLVAWIIGKPLAVRLGGDYAWEQGVQRFGVDMTLDEYTKTPTQVRLPVRLLAFLQRFVVKRACLIVVPSHYLRQIVATWKVDASRLVVLYSVPAIELPAESKETLRQQYGFVGTTLLSIARLTPWKGMKTLITLVEKRRARGEETTLVIGGDGPERKVLEAYAKEQGVADHVQFLGTLPLEDVSRVVKAADVFLLDTAYEGRSHQLLEVMAIGTPIVTTNISGNQELVTNGIHGVLVPVGDVSGYDDAVTQYLTQLDRREKIIEAAKERITQFSVADAIPLLAKELQRVSKSRIV